MKRVFAFVGFAFAFTLILLNVIPVNLHIIILPILAVALILSLVFKKTRQAFVAPLSFGSAMLACLIFMISSSFILAPSVSLAGQEGNALLQINNLPRETNNGYYYIVDAKRIDINNAPQDIKVKLYSKEKLDVDYCDTISANVSFFNINENNYCDGIFIGGAVGDYTVVDKADGSTKAIILNFRQYIKDSVNESFDNDIAGLSLALLTGDVSGLSFEAYNNFKICGFLHFVAVSGFHLSCVCFGLFGLLKLLGVKRKVCVPITVLTAFLYCEIADFSKSVVRATIMITVLLISQMFDKKADTLNSLGLALFLICLNPYAVYDVSTAMTFSSVIGIVIIARPILRSLKFKSKISKYVISCLIVSVSITVALLPSYYYFFGAFSLLSIVINLLFELIITVLLMFVIIFVIVSKIPFLIILPKLIINVLSKLILSSTSLLADKLSFLYVDISNEIFGLMIILFIALLGIMLLIKKEIPIRLSSIILSLLLFVAFSISIYQQCAYSNVRINSNGSVIIWDNSSAVIIDLTDKYDFAQADMVLKSNNAITVNSQAYAQMNNLDNINLSFADDLNMKMSKNISLKTDENIITLYVYEKVFEITEDYVIIDGNRFLRNTDDKYKDTEDIILTFGRDTVIQERRVDNG